MEYTNAMAEASVQVRQCFVCDKRLSSKDRNVLLLSKLTEYSQTGLPTKIGQLMGDGFMVVVTACDEACTRCYDLLNLLDKLEIDLEKVRRLLLSYLRKKYGLLESVKEEPLETIEDPDVVFDEKATRNLEEEVNNVLFAKGGHLDVDVKTSIMDENSRICELLSTAIHSKQPRILTVPSKSYPAKVWKCKVCGFKCKTGKDLKNHEKSHATIAPVKFLFGCNICDFKASSKAELTEHSEKHVFPKSFECEVCNKRFSSQVLMDEHASTHNIYQCADCGAAYEELETLMVHECVPQDIPVHSPVMCEIKVEPSQIGKLRDMNDSLQSDENSQSTDFDSLCRDTLREESEFPEEPDHVENDPCKGSILSPKPGLSSSEVDNPKEDDNSGGGDEEMATVIGLFSGDDEFGDVEDAVSVVQEGGDAEMEEDENVEDEDFLNDEEEVFGEGTTSGKNLNKIFVNGVEVSFADIVSQGGESLLATDLVSTELEEQDVDLKEDEGQAGKSKIFVCTTCKFRTEDYTEIQKHLESHSISLALECEICQMKLKSQRTYDKHMQRHLSLKSPLPVACTVCKEITADKVSLRKHILDNHPELFKCQFCHISFESIRARRKHEATHDVISNKTCDQCGKVFVKLSQLNLHKEYAHRELKCQYCEKQFDTIKKLKDHERRHARDKEGFPCSQCDRVLKTSSGLKLHRAKHTGQYKFCCDVCGGGFMSKAILEEHMGRHTQEKRYTCDVCGKMFVFNSTMRIHRRWHDNPLPYKCKTCGQKFRHTSLLSVHRRRMHTGERPYKCPYCALTFTVSNCLKRHVVLHTGAYPYFCEPCNKGFTTKQKMAMHLAKVHNNKEMLNAKAPPCEYKMVIPNTPVNPPSELDDVQGLVTSMEGVEHAGQMQHVIIQNDPEQLQAGGNIQLQIITMDPDHGFAVFE